MAARRSFALGNRNRDGRGWWHCLPHHSPRDVMSYWLSPPLSAGGFEVGALWKVTAPVPLSMFVSTGIGAAYAIYNRIAPLEFVAAAV